MDYKQNIIDGMRTLDEEKVLETVTLAISEDIDRILIIDWLNLGMKEVGKLYEAEEYYIVELIMSEIIFTSILNLEGFKNWESADSNEPIGTVLLGTVNGDNHDIGKNIFKSMVEACNIKVFDLGVDVPTEIFIQSVKEYQPDILALSGILTSSINELYAIVRRLEEENLRDSLKILIGCPVLNNQSALEIGADAYSDDTATGMEICQKWLREKGRK